MKKIKRLFSLVIAVCVVMTSVIIFTQPEVFAASSGFGFYSTTSNPPSSITCPSSTQYTVSVRVNLKPTFQNKTAQWTGNNTYIECNGVTGSRSTGSTSGNYWSGDFSFPINGKKFVNGQNYTWTIHIQYLWSKDYQNYDDTMSGTFTFNCTHGNYTNSITTQPTCTSTGVRTYYCGYCKSYTYTESVAKTAHNFTSTSTDASHRKSAATCTSPAVYYKSCTVCGANDTSNTFTSGSSLGHDFSSKTTTPTYLKSAANCTSPAVYYYKCSRCAESSSSLSSPTTYNSGSVNSSNHNYTTDSTDVSHLVSVANCTTPATYYYSCTRCGANDTSRTFTSGSVNSSNHTNVDADWTTTVPVACTTNGTRVKYCRACNAIAVSETITAPGHTFTSQTKTSTYLKTPATCTVDAVYYYKCENCSESSSSLAEPTTYTDVGSAPGHNYVATVHAPTCTVDGYTTHECSVCHDTYTDSIVTAPGHTSPSDWDNVVPATCSVAGVREKHCTVCGTLLESEPIATVAHTWGVGVESPVATCTTDGTITYTCTVCGATTTETVTAPGHNYELTSNTATCTAAGTKTYTCSRCSDSYTEPSVALGHDYSSVVTPPTCEEAGYTTHTCSRCSDSYTDTPVAATGHDWGAWTLTADPSAPARGTETRVCGNNPAHTQSRTSDVVDTTTNTEIAITADTFSADRCNDKIVSVTASVDPGETSFSELRYRVVNSSYVGPYSDIADNDANVVAAGNVIESESWISTPQSGTINLNTSTWPAGTYRVMLAAYVNSGSRSLAGGRQTDYYQYATMTVEDTGHTWVAGAVTAPTCTEDGYTTYTCSDCGGTKQDDVVAALGHNYVLSSTTTAPTCTSAGEGVYTCSRCGDEITDTIAIDENAHSYDSGVVTTEPTCTTAGEKLYTCQYNNEHTYTETVAALGHTIEGAEWEVTTAPTYSSAGERVKRCTRCNTIVTTEVMPVLTAPTAVTVTPASSIVEVGATQQLTPTFTPEGATATAATWTSSDPTIATVSSIGLVTGVATGAVMITYSFDNDPTVTDSVSVTVVPAQSTTTTDIVNTNPSLDVNVGSDTTSITVTGSSCEASADGSNTFDFSIALALSSTYINTPVEEGAIVAVVTLDNNYAATNGYKGISGTTVYPAVGDSVFVPLSVGTNTFSIVSPTYITPNEDDEVVWHVAVYLGGTAKAPKNTLLYNSVVTFENLESDDALLAVSAADPILSQADTTKNIIISHDNISSLSVSIEAQNPSTGIYTLLPALTASVTLGTSGQNHLITIGTGNYAPGTTLRLTFTGYDSSHNVVATDKCYLVVSWLS